MINHEVKLKDEAAMSHFSNYQKQVYEFIAEFESTESKKRRKQIEKSLSQVRESYKKEIDAILLAYRNNKKIQLYQKRLDELDMYLEDAYLAASKIHDKTIEEMDETYQLAEEKYNEFVSSIDRNNYPLDDFLYEALQDSKKRLEEKMLYASMTLDDKVGKAIETYKALYFKLNLKFDSKPVTKTLDEYLNQLQAIDQTFDQTNEEITNQYQIKVETYNTDIRQIQNHYQQLMNENTKEKNLEIQQKTTLINDKDAVFNDYIKQVKRQHQIELNQLVESYLNDVQTNKQMNQEVSDDYQSLIDAYKPYIQYSKKSKTIKRLIRQTLHAQKKAHRRDLKSLKKDIKRLTLK
jgi:hypothetical protein